MTEANQSSRFSRRNAIALFAAGTAFGADAALARAFGSAPATATLRRNAADAARACAPPSDVASLAAEHFEPLLGEEFTVGGHRVTLRSVRRGPATPAHFRQQFAVVFAAPRELSLASEPTPVAHPAIGHHDLFVTQMVDGLDRGALEICFS
jgi:hypothetical protein